MKLSLCSKPEVMEVMRIVNLSLNIIRILAPVLLVLVSIIKLFKAVVDANDDKLENAKRTLPLNFLVAAMIFFVPMLILSIINLVSPENDIKDCLVIKTREEINAAYEKEMENLVSIAESTGNIKDYNEAKNYIANIKDSTKKEKFEQRLKSVKNKIDTDTESKIDSKYSELEKENVLNNYGRVDYNDWSWTYYARNSGPITTYYNKSVPYAIWAPTDKTKLKNTSLPLIVWLHGSGETIEKANQSTFLNRGLLAVVSNWNSYNLASIPAIIVAPQSPGDWRRTENYETIKALIEYTKNEYNVDTSNVVLMGHSMGGNGAIYVASALQGVFKKVVVMSSGITSYGDRNYYASLPMKGYGEYASQASFFKWCYHENDFTVYSGTAHGQIPAKALSEDLNNDGVSDLIYWLFGKNSTVIDNSEADLPKDSTTNSEPTTKAPTSSSSTTTTTNQSNTVKVSGLKARPITDYVDINAVNTKIANAVKRAGLYTRSAVVNAATTTVSALEEYDYYIPYQLGGMYHRGNRWGLNPEWGTITYHNDKYVLSGLDCRNFVHWAFKQAGLSLIRGFGYEGAFKSGTDNRYSNISDGRPGDVIDAPQHLMLIVKNNGNSYTVAEANGVGRVRIYDWTYQKIKNDGYSVYNMDAVYNNTGKYCPSTSSYRAYPGSCHIPKSEFPSYYGF